MATLWWTATQYTLSEASENIGEVLGAIGDELPRHGYTGVQVSGDVHGFKGDLIVAVRYLFIADRTFWQVVAAAGSGSVQEAQAEVGEVEQVIRQLKFL